MSEMELDKLRRRIRRLDGRILELARKRIDLAETIGRWKLAHGVPIRNYEAERDVLELAAERCSDLGLDPTLGRAIARALIGGAVKVQEDLHEQKYDGTKKRISIIGGKGKMGQWVAQYLYSRGHRVTIHDTAGRLRGFHNTSRLDRAVHGAEIIIVAVPLQPAGRIYAEIRAMKPSGTIVDLLSLKSPIMKEIEKALADGLSVTSIHPLFGPDVYLLSDRILLLCRCGSPRADREVADLFEGTSLDTVEMDVAEHDRAMGIVLGLSHAVGFVFTEAMALSGLTKTDLDRVATVTYEKQVRTAEELVGENPRLYYDIQKMNRYSSEVYSLFERALTRFRKASTSRSDRAFLAMIKRGREFFGKK